MCQGVAPCSPIHPTAAVTFRALELLCIVWLHSPHFSIQAFVKTLCDLQGVIFQCYLSHQFSIAFDLYLQIHAQVDSIVSQVLQRDSEDWHLKHACAACTYKLTDEPKLKFKLLYAMDGNNSLKHDSDSNPCAGCWRNMDDVKTKKAWGVYDETGIFMVVCHHGTCLLMADMVQSGECAKYPLVVVLKLMAAFSDGLGSGYDIGCQFQSTLATNLNHTCLVGAFHGHAHHCLCQLSHLTLYVEGLGLEDLETCERTFSKSNALASTVRYATTFHQQQAINAYFEHNDNFEIYTNLTKFLFDNYKQALMIIHDSKTILPDLKHDLSIDDDTIFHRWLEEEKKYLEGLSCEPLEETLQMEYWQRLGKLENPWLFINQQHLTWLPPSPHTRVSSCSSPPIVMRKEGIFMVTWWNKTLRQHAQENYDKDLLLVQELECKLDISLHWILEDKEWQNAGHLVANREYRHALDNLESLVVAWLFELTKMNRAGTGYKLWKHIAKALQTRSAAIKMLQWEQVVEYAFLADFDLLWDMCEDISQFITYMCNEERFLHTCEEKISNIHPALAHQVSQHCMLHLQFNCFHLKCLHDIATFPEFSSILYPGKSCKG
ncbi:hypothetical protein EDC04DRAFT_2873538 [Pisolithus marmoratus]|nr:hypothetical protein EDC04DRAFT_2873538 [Pisolithus marmoratus]